MSDDIGLDEAEQEEYQLQIAVANAQRLLNDEGLQHFFSAQRRIGEHQTVYGETPGDRELGRAKVIVIDDLRGLLAATAKVNQDREAAEAHARTQE